MMYKTCSICKFEHPINFFNKKKTGKFGVNGSCKECTRKAGSSYYQENKVRITKYRKDTNENERQKAWRKNNQHVKNYFTAEYRALKNLATPKWLTKEDKAKIRVLYKEAKILTNVTGVSYHVDHVMPLKSDILCGLHVPWNLQILKGEENLKKSNKVDREAIAVKAEELPDSKE